MWVKGSSITYSPDAVSSQIKTLTLEYPVEKVVKLNSPSKPNISPKRGLCCLHRHNSLSEDHPDLQDEAKMVPAKKHFSAFCKEVSTEGFGLSQ